MIKNVFGKEQGTNMLSFEKTDSSIGVTVSAYHSNLSYEGKKFHFILFINNRLVNCKSIKQMVESVFATFLGKTTKVGFQIAKTSFILDSWNIALSTYKIHINSFDVQPFKMKLVLGISLVLNPGLSR